MNNDKIPISILDKGGAGLDNVAQNRIANAQTIGMQTHDR